MKIIKIFKNIIAIWLTLSIVVFFTTSCEDQLSDLNISPNKLSDKEVDIKYVLTGILTTSSKVMVGMVYDGAIVPSATQYLQRDMTSYEENNYVWSSVAFYGFYEQIKDSDYIFERAETEKTDAEKDYYQAVALIMKSYWYGWMTSAFGDIPYSKAMQAEEGGDEFFKPVYDAQEDVFIGILEDLKTANDLLKSVTVCDVAADADIMYHGDGLKWRMFANSLRLRYYMRLSEKTGLGINPGNEIATIVGDQNQYPIMEANTDNAVVDFVGTDAYNSWPGGALDFSFRSEFYRRKPSATIIDELVSLNDPRLTKWVRPVDVQILQGATNEIVMEGGFVKRYVDIDINALNSDGNAENDISTDLYVGLAVALTAPDDYNLGGTVDQNSISALDGGIYLQEASNPHLSYLAEMYADNSNSLVQTIFMNSAEVQFILSEACHRGWIGGNANDYYTSGIESSFEQYGIADGDEGAVYDQANQTHIAFDKAAYIANTQAIYDAAADKMEPIINQKWISLWMTSESWFDWRRTGIPNLTKNINSGTNGQNIPLRFWYDDTYNEDNMLDAITRLTPAENDQWSKMWLLK